MGVWKGVFWLAAAFNLLVGLPMVLAPKAFYEMAKLPMPDILSAQTAGWLIAVFGIGYAIVARDPPANRAIVWLGVIGKSLLPVLVWIQIQAGAMPMSAILLPLGDWVFVALFLAFLLRTKLVRG